MKGKLTLIPTPIDESSPLEQTAFNLLSEAASDLSKNTLAIEDLKPGRRRWLHFGLTRDVVEDFVLYNEHTKKEACKALLKDLKSGKNVFLMSDGGLPAFCDPGVDLVRECHLSGIEVCSAPFSNSISLALAMSGLDHNSFSFAGFLPIKSPERESQLDKFLKRGETTIFMDTPYRMKKLLQEIQSHSSGRIAFLAMDLNCETQECYFGKISSFINNISDFKREFILIIGPSN
ncbi:SAM-dependent methyltransferase [Halobacteriovorax sp. HLS]|uniref:SAM-dependent methyltransferase n=1 Tax=Halobacteriovorax sp. HLS TaxID=2234000 RepID=UPI000FDB3B09|nr:SAM-dependent methyltransferase [Halobacteriovorax sp. HLS]